MKRPGHKVSDQLKRRSVAKLPSLKGGDMNQDILLQAIGEFNESLTKLNQAILALLDK